MRSVGGGNEIHEISGEGKMGFMSEEGYVLHEINAGEKWTS